MEHITIPETIPEQSTADKIVDLAIELVDTQLDSGESNNSEYSSALFYVPDNDLEDGKYPSLKITVPKEEHSERNQWRAELTFGNQDATLSSHVLIRKGGVATVTNYAEDRNDRDLSDEQSEALFHYLDDLKNKLIADKL